MGSNSTTRQGLDLLLEFWQLQDHQHQRLSKMTDTLQEQEEEGEMEGGARDLCSLGEDEWPGICSGTSNPCLLFLFLRTVLNKYCRLLASRVMCSHNSSADQQCKTKVLWVMGASSETSLLGL